jgi:hypothetical protein
VPSSSRARGRHRLYESRPVQTVLAVDYNSRRARVGMAFLDSMVLTQHSRCDSNMEDKISLVHDFAHSTWSALCLGGWQVENRA